MRALTSANVQKVGSLLFIGTVPCSVQGQPSCSVVAKSETVSSVTVWEHLGESLSPAIFDNVVLTPSNSSEDTLILTFFRTTTRPINLIPVPLNSEGPRAQTQSQPELSELVPRITPTPRFTVTPGLKNPRHGAPTKPSPLSLPSLRNHPNSDPYRSQKTTS